MATIVGAERQDTTEVAVILGVDTHLHFHVAVAVDHLGRRLGESSVPTSARGYEKLLRWAEGFGPVRVPGVEGTSSYGAGLARHLSSRGIEVLEVERPSTSGGAHAVTSRSPTPQTPTALRERFWLEKRRVCPRAATGVWR